MSAFLLRAVYDLGPREKAAMFKIIDECATDKESMPDLIDRLSGKDTACAYTSSISWLASTGHMSAAALVKQLDDSNKGIRQAALGALMNMDGEIDVERISALLMDPDMAVQNKAVDLLVKAAHPIR